MKKLLAVLLCLVLSTTLAGCSMFMPARPVDDYTAEATYDDLPDDYTTVPSVNVPDVTQAPTIGEVNIRPAEWANVQWQPYSNE